ncbi:uncharacterized protein [Lolium perenne]|jgi:hypothetical protein|uniref:uncharacterized protein n=1 Tax=Lolium perenne TaxID=4522 RepID=UPI0021EB0563|nr:uncharacterized protein LOC127336815 [Lolium perenne]
MRRQKRWSRAAVVACLAVLLTAACAESSCQPGRRLLAASWEEAAATGVRSSESGDADDGPRRSAFDVVVEGLVSIGLGRRWRAGGDPLVDQDKRRVPTGPNPLHNR